MHGPREVLNELKWRDGLALEASEIEYVHHGAPGDARIVSGKEVRALHTSFMELLDGGFIPYHRVLRIHHAGALVWERAAKENH